jgi:hypothetical protein
MGEIAVVFEVPGMTAEQYDETIRRLAAEGLASPSDRRSHVAAGTDAGWLVVDVWSSPEALDAFARRLMPILASVGVPPFEPRVLPAHAVVLG